MHCFKHIGDTVFVNGLEVPMNIFNILEPAYTQQSTFEALTYDGSCLRVRINGITSTISGKWADGDRFVSRRKDFESLLRLIRKEDQEVADTVDPVRDPDGCRKNGYPLVSDLVVALWEHLVEKKDLASSGIDNLQTKRLMVKDKYPMKETTQNGNNQLSGKTEGLLPTVARKPRNRNKHSG